MFIIRLCYTSFFFFNDTATTEIYTLSLHDALPICQCQHTGHPQSDQGQDVVREQGCERKEPRRIPWKEVGADRKSTRLNSSHDQISYAVFCLKKKNKQSNAESMTDTRANARCH